MQKALSMNNPKIPEVNLLRSDTSKPFKWASPEIGFRNKIGGIPNGIPESDFPNCKDCGKQMTFYGQLDSLSDEVVIADCGTIAVFVCFDCFTTQSIIVSP